MSECSYPGCDRKHYGKGFCQRHYLREYHRSKRGERGSGPQSGDDWHRARLAKGHEPVTAQGVRLPSLEEADWLPIEVAAQIADPFDVVEYVEHKIVVESLRRVIAALSERERRVLEFRYGFVDGVEWTLEAIGRELDLTRERVRQIQHQALVRLSALREVACLASPPSGGTWERSDSDRPQEDSAPPLEIWRDSEGRVVPYRIDISRHDTEERVTITVRCVDRAAARQVATESASFLDGLARRMLRAA